jgi:hypothetical protein
MHNDFHDEVSQVRNYLLSHCPTYGCYAQPPVCTLESDTNPNFDPTLYVVVKCPNCKQEFRELASSLEMSLTAIPLGKSQS